MSAPIRCWMSMLSSGVQKCAEPSTIERNATPSSLTLTVSARLKTWKPPESVSVVPLQPMNRFRPPADSTTSTPGRRNRWYALESTVCAPSSARREGRTPFTVARVPTGMKSGVSTGPCAVASVPRRADVVAIGRYESESEVGHGRFLP